MAAILNGRLPLGSLAPIPWAPSHRLRPDAAAALTRLNAAFRAAFGHDLIVNEGYRDYATQESYRARTRLPRTDPRWLPSASRPGTSEHGWGLAVDLGQLGGFGSAKHRWLTQNAPRHGFYQPAQYQASGAYPEPWHWEYDPARDQHRHERPAAAAPPPPAPAAPDPSWEDDMSSLSERAIEAAYRRHLGRTPSVAEMDDRIERIAADANPAARLRAELAGIAGSDEAKRRPVKLLYQRLLGRTASDAEADGWLKSAGGDLAKVEAGIKGSAEYKRKTAQ